MLEKRPPRQDNLGTGIGDGCAGPVVTFHSILVQAAAFRTAKEENNEEQDEDDEPSWPDLQLKHNAYWRFGSSKNTSERSPSFKGLAIVIIARPSHLEGPQRWKNEQMQLPLALRAILRQ